VRSAGGGRKGRRACIGSDSSVVSHRRCGHSHRRPTELPGARKITPATTDWHTSRVPPMVTCHCHEDEVNVTPPPPPPPPSSALAPTPTPTNTLIHPGAIVSRSRIPVAPGAVGKAQGKRYADIGWRGIWTRCAAHPSRSPGLPTPPHSLYLQHFFPCASLIR